MSKVDDNNVLVAIVPSKNDFEIAKNMHWYRIPVGKAQPMIKNNTIRYIAFYLPKIFENEKYSIRYYAEVKNCTIVKRKELFPEAEGDFKAESEYYKIEFGPLLSLPKPIISQRQRRLIFIPTSEQKFFNATEINHLFNDSKLEEILWAKLIENKISAERQFVFSVGDKYYFLDFAIFCKNGNINVECDGDSYHSGQGKVQYDKNRNNLLESKGWSVLRFTTENLTEQLGESVTLVCETINKYGGVQDVQDENKYRLIRPDIYSQFFLFDDE